MSRQLLGLALLLAAFLRLFDLGRRPIHHDEAVNWFLLGRVLREGGYHYDPTNYHGPLHFQLGALTRAMLGTELDMQRLPLALAGLLLVAAMARLAPDRPVRAALIAALAASSPALVYYARDAIHETWLGLFTATALLAVVAALRAPGPLPAIALGASLGAMIATKETCVLTFAAWAVGIGCAWLVDREAVRVALTRLWPWWRQSLLALTAVVVLSYTNLLQTPGELIGLAQTLWVWGERGLEGGGHAKAAHWLLDLLARNDGGALVLGTCGLLLVRGRPEVAFAAGWAVSLLAAYSAIPYKTPWLLVQIVIPWLLLAAVTLEALLARQRLLGLLIAAAVIGGSTARTWYTSLLEHDDPDLGLAYVQTHRDLPALLGEVRAAVTSTQGAWVHTVHPSGYPTNWYLRGLDLRADHKPPLPQTLDAPVLLLAGKDEAEVHGKLTRPYLRKEGFFRRGMRIVALVDPDLDAHLGEGWELIAPFGPPSEPPEPPAERLPGLLGTWYGQATPRGEPFLVEPRSQLDLGWSRDRDKPRSAPLFVSWEGWLDVPQTGLYGLQLQSDDGSRLWLDGELVLDHWGVHGKTKARTGRWLEAGMHHLHVAWFDLGGPGALQLSWQAPDEAWTLIPEEVLSHTPRSTHP